ncbi:MAG: tandem-95 repeat protein [Magnetococcales bacterium]|nr:tandem-95 repeat protein [Magnetococcales bacterium]
MKKPLLLAPLLALALLVAGFQAQAAAPTVANPLANQTWSGSGNKTFWIHDNVFADSDGDPLTYSVTRADGSALPAWLRFSAETHLLSGNPPADAGTVNLKLTASDGHGGTAETLFSIVCRSTNDVPTVATTPANRVWSGSGSKSLQVPATIFTDRDRDRLTYSATQASGAALPSWLRFAPDTRTFSGNPPSGADALSLMITANDTHGGTTSSSFRLSFTGTNDPPVVATPIADQTWSGSGGKTFLVPRSTFSDQEGHSLTYWATLANGSPLPSWLRFAPSTRTFSGNPPAGVTALNLKVIANDGHGGRVSAPFRLSFTGSTNDAPVAVADTLTVSNAQPLSDTLTARDRDGDPLTYTLLSNTSNGRIVLTNPATGAFTYTPNSGASGTDSFTFKVNDGQADSNTATVTLTIPPNTPPVASDGRLNVARNRTNNSQLIASDADGNALTYRLVTTGTKGTATLTNNATGAYTYTPRSGATGADSFTFLVNDGLADSNTATITITRYPAPVRKTGQEISYRAGDDGALKKGQDWPDPRFTDNGNGTVTDHLTDLVWMKNANCWDRRSWSNALDTIAGLNAGSQHCSGYTGKRTDWRLPNRKELTSLIDRSRTNPALPSGHPFSGVQSGYHQLSYYSTAPATRGTWTSEAA